MCGQTGWSRLRRLLLLPVAAGARRAAPPERRREPPGGGFCSSSIPSSFRTITFFFVCLWVGTQGLPCRSYAVFLVLLTGCFVMGVFVGVFCALGRSHGYQCARNAFLRFSAKFRADRKSGDLFYNDLSIVSVFLCSEICIFISICI